MDFDPADYATGNINITDMSLLIPEVSDAFRELEGYPDCVQIMVLHDCGEVFAVAYYWNGEVAGFWILNKNSDPRWTHSDGPTL